MEGVMGEGRANFWRCPFDGYPSSMRDIVILVHQVPGHTKVTDLYIQC